MTIQIEDRLDRIEALLERLVAATEARPACPLTASRPDPVLPNRRCSKCGIQLSGVMGYCCSDLDCPTGLGPMRL